MATHFYGKHGRDLSDKIEWVELDENIETNKTVDTSYSYIVLQLCTRAKLHGIGSNSKICFGSQPWIACEDGNGQSRHLRQIHRGRSVRRVEPADRQQEICILFP